ncbi:Similar to shakB: Innexin shaking-B (Aedes aegypti) [Cotesia congregata]|uniref:Innexin n=1 Tax=Cotesia congregata TaxID=51543 RepID=A0A8J2MTS2_COTCN|nr:Similar to shakB: Innexin shaking-B (Aedes aegypti) [Cotesia congregata]
MLDIFRGLKSLIKSSNIHTDTSVFRLHYRFTVIGLIACSLIVTTRQYVGNPIDCIHSKDLPEDVLNTYCWIHSTYTIVSAYKKKGGVEVAFPGVDNSRLYPESERKEYRGRGDELDKPIKMPIMLKMIDIFGSLRSLFKVRKTEEDTLIFRLHYRVTVALLLAGCLTLACKSISGSPIHCEGSSAVETTVLETFCWLHTTYSMINAFNLTVGRAVPYPGLTNSKTDVHVNDNHPLVKHHKYYQWVIFALLLQAILFYTPRWLWKGWEGGKIHALMMDLDIGLCSEVEKKQKKKMLLDYLWENLRYHNWWAYRYYLCEVLALVNVIGQMFLMDRFFDGAFLTFGIDVLRFLESDQEDRIDPMIYVFPRMTKCTFYKYGVSGEVERHDAVCILPLNVVNEKIYVFLWFWFLLLGILSLLTVIYRVSILVINYLKRDAVETIVRRSKVGDWFLLYMLGENLDTIIYRDVMHELANKLSTRHHHNVSTIKGELQEA